MKEAIRKLREARAKLYAELEGIVNTAADESRDMSEDETTKFTALKTEIEQYDTRISDLAEMEDRNAAVGEKAAKLEGEPPPTSRMSVQARQPTYARGAKNEDGTFRSFFKDLWDGTRGNSEANQRLDVHMKEQRTEVERRTANAESEARADGFEIESRAINTTATSGGEFVPPLWLIDAYAPLARAGRTFADGFNRRPLPPGTNSINIPRITTGSTVAAQTANNAAVSSTDLVTTSLAAPVVTIAGQEDLSIQLLEQSPTGMDEVIFLDLIADYNAKLDVQALNGSGSSGQALGVLNVSGINSVAYTDSTPTVPEIYPKISDGLQQIGTKRFLPATAMYMHPRRWGWFMAALDSSNRPLVVPSGQGPNNALSLQQGGPYDYDDSNMVVGQLQGLPVYTDANIPTTLNSSTQDVIIQSRMTDHWLWEGVLRTRVLPEILSGTLGVRCQVYNYVALTAGRFPAATSIVLGTGTVAPTF